MKRMCENVHKKTAGRLAVPDIFLNTHTHTHTSPNPTRPHKTVKNAKEDKYFDYSEYLHKKLPFSLSCASRDKSALSILSVAKRPFIAEKQLFYRPLAAIHRRAAAFINN